MLKVFYQFVRCSIGTTKVYWLGFWARYFLDRQNDEHLKIILKATIIEKQTEGFDQRQNIFFYFLKLIYQQYSVCIVAAKRRTHVLMEIIFTPKKRFINIMKCRVNLPTNVLMSSNAYLYYIQHKPSHYKGSTWLHSFQREHFALLFPERTNTSCQTPSVKTICCDLGSVNR